RRIEEREALLRDILVFNERRLPDGADFARGDLVIGSVVIGEDYFKRVAAGLKGFFGGRLTVYESLMDRGRREAVIRMKEEAGKLGATMVFNVRFETSSLSEDSSGGRAAFSAEFIAYGTALIPAR
ncbi:MAG: YbjQ family protein, partial [Candidatus Binatia bacterium]